MATYFEAYNDNNKVLIDDNVARLHLTRTSTLNSCGTLEAVYDANPSGYSVEINVKYSAIFTIRLHSGETLMSIRITDDNNTSMDTNGAGLVGISVSKWSDETYRVWITSVRYSSIDISNDYLLSLVASKIKCYFWGVGTTSTDRFGLQIFNQDGEQIFHSGDIVMNITGTFFSSHDFPRSGDIPYVNTNISNKKSLLIHTTSQQWCRWRNSADFSWGFLGLYTENGVYKFHPFCVGALYRDQTVWNSGSITRDNVIYLIDIPEGV